MTRTGTQSRKKSRDVLLATLVMRTRRVALVSSPVVHARPQVSLALPSIRLAMLVVSVPVCLAAVQLEPLFHESSTQCLGDPLVLSARESRRTSTPLMVAPAGIEMG